MQVKVISISSTFVFLVTVERLDYGHNAQYTAMEITSRSSPQGLARLAAGVGHLPATSTSHPRSWRRHCCTTSWPTEASKHPTTTSHGRTSRHSSASSVPWLLYHNHLGIATGPARAEWKTHFLLCLRLCLGLFSCLCGRGRRYSCYRRRWIFCCGCLVFAFLANSKGKRSGR